MQQPPDERVNAYSTNQRESETGRSVDAHALLRCASQLEAARQESCSRQDYVEAIKHNMRLWTIFQTSVLDPDCPLPQEIRINLYKLSRYVDKLSFPAIAKRDPDALANLINVNRQIAAGLSAGQQRPPQAPPASQPPPDMKPIEITT